MDKKYEFLGRGVWDFFPDNFLQTHIPDVAYIEELWNEITWLRAEMCVKDYDNWHTVHSVRLCNGVLPTHYINGKEKSLSKVLALIDGSTEQRQKKLIFEWKTSIESVNIA